MTPPSVPQQRFRALVHPHWDALYAMACRYACNNVDAHDLLQETMLRAWRGFINEPDRAYHRGWLIAILRRIAIEWHRADQRRVRLVPIEAVDLTEVCAAELGEPLAPMPTMSDERFRQMLDARMVEALDGLEPQYREVLLLHAVGDLRYREIAELLECPVGTVMSRMARARRLLRERLATMAAGRRSGATAATTASRRSDPPPREPSKGG